MANDVLEYFRSKDSRFKDVSDIELTKYIAESRPEFLKDPDFRDQANQVIPPQQPNTSPEVNPNNAFDRRLLTCRRNGMARHRPNLRT